MPYQTSVPFRGATEGYASFRVPACVRAPDGSLLAFAEGRVHSAADSGDIDLVLKRSVDGGRSWGPLQLVDRNGDGSAGNPAPVVCSAIARTVLVFVRAAADATEERIRRGAVSAADGRRVWVRHSDDSGQTWSPPRDITESVKHPEWRWYATGPGHGVQLSQPPCAGRLVVPGNHSIPPAAGDDGTEGRYDGGHSLLSDDAGASWRIGYLDDTPDGRVNVNETGCAELPDGAVYFNARNESRDPATRVHARSADGGSTLCGPFQPERALTAPVVQAPVLQLSTSARTEYPFPDRPLLFAAPRDPLQRRRMTVWASDDGGARWRVAHTVDDRPAAYSDLVEIDDTTLGLLYETGTGEPYETMTFRRIPTEEL